MRMSFVFPTILRSDVARPLAREVQLSEGRSIAIEGIAVWGRARSVLRSSALVLLLIAILAD